VQQRQREVVDVTEQRAVGPVDVLVGAGLGAAGLLWRAAGPARAVSAGLARGAVAMATGAAPATVEGLHHRGRAGWAQLQTRADALLRTTIGRVLEAFLDSVDLTALVCEYLDLDAVADTLDVDRVVARVDPAAVVGRIDLDAIAAALDVDRVVARVDLDAVVRRIDVDAIAAALDVDGVVARVDLDAVVARIDLVGIARDVVDAIDLPEIVRHSTGALTSDTVRSVRTGTRHADNLVAGAVDRLLHRPAAGGSAVPAPG
jgi:hypothetical protein